MQVIPTISKVLQYVQDAQLILDMIDRQATPFLVRFADEEVKREYGKAMLSAKQSLQAALQATRGVEELSQDEIDQAFADFRESYRNLQEVLRRAGLVGGGSMAGVKMKAGPDVPQIDVPEPMAVSEAE